MARPGPKPKKGTETQALGQAKMQLRELRAHAHVEQLKAVRRMVRAGLSDNQIAKRLHIGRAKVADYRKELELEANPLGGAFD